jgi:hypothetical protein
MYDYLYRPYYGPAYPYGPYYGYDGYYAGAMAGGYGHGEDEVKALEQDGKGPYGKIIDDHCMHWSAIPGLSDCMKKRFVFADGTMLIAITETGRKRQEKISSNELRQMKKSVPPGKPQPFSDAASSPPPAVPAGSQAASAASSQAAPATTGEFAGWDPYGYPYGYMDDWYLPYPMYQTSGIGDVTWGPHLISPLGWPYAWGQALGIWGQKDEAPSDGGRVPSGGGGGGGAGAGDERRRPGGRDHRRHRDHDRDGDGMDWSTIAWAGLGIVGVFGAIYLITRKQG